MRFVNALKVSMESDEMVTVEVCYCSPNHQYLHELSVPEDSTLQQAIELSGILRDIPEIDLGRAKVGIYSKIKSLTTRLKQHDRIEIYRPLLVDPMVARRTRAHGRKK